MGLSPIGEALTMTLVLAGRGTNTHNHRLTRTSYSKSIVAFQLGSFIASKCDLGIDSIVRQRENAR